MKILFVCSGNSKAGISPIVERQAESLIQSGIDLSYFTIKGKGQDKGHSQEMKEFLDAIRNGHSCPIPFNDSYLSTLATFKVLESIRENRMINMI